MTFGGSLSWIEKIRLLWNRSSASRVSQFYSAQLYKGRAERIRQRVMPIRAEAKARRTNYGMNDLHYLAARTNVDTLRKKAKKKPKLLEERDVFGRRPLDVAIQNQNLAATEILKNAMKETNN